MIDPFEDFLSGFETNVAEVSKALRGVIQQAMPEGKEVFSQEQKHLAYSIHGTPGEDILLLAPKKDFVFLVFKNSKQLSDSDGLLGGPGKQTRFMTVRSVEEANKPELSHLIQAAWANASGQAVQQ